MASEASPLPEEMQAIDASWRALSERTLVRQSWPAEKGVSGMEALRRWAPEPFESLSTKHALVRRFGVIPIIAVVGLLNSGKSSLTASFLSEAGRARVLRGAGQRQGSQRFTLWFPAEWRQDESFFENLLQLLTRVFAQEPEILSDDEEEAWRQQNDVTAFERPLLATDPQLAKHQLAILDCPDIQRAHVEDFRTRLETVKSAAELCAAVLVVFARRQMEIRDLEKILDCMPEAHRVYAVNFLRREEPQSILREARQVLEMPEGAMLFGAYDFLHSDYADFTPSWDPNRELSREERMARSHPCFFEIKDSPEENSPEAVDPDRSILALGSRISPHAMKSRRTRELAREYFQTLGKGLDEMKATLAEEAKVLGEARERLAEECRYLVSQGEHIRIKISPAMVRSLEQSLSRTASLQYKWLLFPPRKFLQACHRLLEKARSVASPTRELREQKRALEKKWNVRSAEAVGEGAVTPKDLQRMLSLWSGATGDYRDPEQWEKEAQTILERFMQEDKTNLTDDEWDTLTRSLWKNLPMKARLKLFSSVFLMLGGLTLAFVDGGVSFVTLHALDLLGGLGVLASLGVNLQGTQEFERLLEERLGLQQIANFHAIVCDVIGLPRSSPDASLPAPTVPSKPSVPSYGVQERQWCLYDIDSPTVTRLRSHGF